MMKRTTARISLIVFAILINAFASIGQVPSASITQASSPSYLPDRRDVVLYQVNMRTFSATGNFKGVSNRLDSIKSLGINVIYLMPIYPIGTVNSVNSPYCIKDYKAVNEEFGNLDDLRALVDSIHHKKMAVILDWVANHTSFDHKWVNNKSWYLQDSTGNIISPPKTGWNDVAQLNFSNKDMREEMIASMKYWVTTANIDGFRCDYADGPPFDFWKQAIDSLKHIPNHPLLLLAEGKRSDHYTAGFDYNFGFSFFENLQQIYKHNKSVKSIDSLNAADKKGAKGGQQMVRYTTNHDVNGSDGTPEELFGGEKGALAAFVPIAYMQSVPMIYNGQEVGTPYRLVFPFTTKKIDWAINPATTATYKKIIAFRNSSNAIRRGTLTSYSNNDICVFIKKSGAEEVLVLSNMRDKRITYTLPSKVKNSNWKDAYTGSPVKIKTVITLEPYSWLVLKN